jgi:cation:H+ antiporter
VAVLLTLRFPRWLAFTLLGLFAAQYAAPGQAGRYLLCAAYGGIAVVALVRNRRYCCPIPAGPAARARRSWRLPRGRGRGRGRGPGPGWR